MSRRWGRSAALLFGGVLVLAACGQGTEPGADGDATISDIAASTEAAGSARFEGSSEMTSDDASYDMRSTGEIDFANGRAVIRTTTKGPDGEVDEREMRTVDGYTYFESLPFSVEDGEPMPSTKPWSRMPASYGAGALMPLGGSADMTSLLAVLEEMGATTEVVGTEVVRGATTTRIQVKPGEPPDLPDQVEVTGEYSTSGSDEKEEERLDIWVDDQNRLRRFRVEGYSFELFDFGVPVNVVAPPADQVDTRPFAEDAAPEDYELVATGDADGSPWKVLVAATGNTRCMAVEADVARIVGLVRGSKNNRIELGCSSWGSAVAPEFETDATYDPDFIDLEPESLPLENGQALLVSAVPKGTTAVILHLRGGGTREAEIGKGYFGAALGPDEVAETIEFTTPARPVKCTLDKDIGYDCDDYPGRGLPNSDSGSTSTSATTVEGEITQLTR